MKLMMSTPGHRQWVEIEGADARAQVRFVMASIAGSILLPTPPHTGVMRRRVADRLRQGEVVWTHPDRKGQKSARSTMIMLVPPVIGVIDDTGVTLLDPAGNAVTDAAVDTPNGEADDQSAEPRGTPRNEHTPGR